MEFNRKLQGLRQILALPTLNDDPVRVLVQDQHLQHLFVMYGVSKIWYMYF